MMSSLTAFRAAARRNRRIRCLLGRALPTLVGVAATLSGPQAIAQSRGSDEVARQVQTELALSPIEFRLRDGSIIEAERGMFEVPEHRADPTSRRIRIGFVRFRSTSPSPGAPIVYLAGGPGGSGIDAANGPRQPIFLALRSLGDVIALDQRGVGISNSVPPCTANGALDPAAGLSEASLSRYYRDTLAKCVEGWRAAGVAVEGYTTFENADDVEALRLALRASRLRLWAISYGTHLALEVMRRHPGSVERVVLASVEGMDQTVKLPGRVDAALGRLDRSAGATFSSESLLETMRRVHARLDAHPQQLTIGTGPDQVRFVMDSFALRMLVGGIAKDPAGIEQLRQLYAAFDAGQQQAVAPVLHGLFFARPLTMGGMPELMDIASGISAARRERVGGEGEISVVGAATNFPMPQLSGALPDLDLGPAFRSEVRSPVPTLVLSGDLDLRTPIEEQVEATAGLSNVTRVTVHGGGHDLYEAHPAISGLVVDFLAGRPVTIDRLTLPASGPQAQGSQ